MFSGWILQITGIIILSVLADIAVPGGKTNKILKCVFSFVCMFVVVQPIFWIKDGRLDIDEILSGGKSAYVSQEFLDNVSGSKLELLEQQCDRLLLEEGYEVKTSIIGTYFDKLSIEKIFIKTDNSVILENESHILRMKETVSGLFNVDTECISIYG